MSKVQEYKNKYDRDNYYSINFRIPISYREKFHELSKIENKSINQLIFDAINEVYHMDMLPKSKACDKYIARKLQILEDLCVRDIDSAAEQLRCASESSELLNEKIQLIDMAFDRILNNK